MMKGLKGGQFDGYSVERRMRFNPNTSGAREMQTIKAGDSIPDGWSISGTSYRSLGERHDATLLHIKPEVQNQTLASRAHELHQGWTPDLPPADDGPVKLFERRGNR